MSTQNEQVVVGNMELPPVEGVLAEARMRAFLQGDLVLADLCELSHEELYDIAQRGRGLYEAGRLDLACKVFEGLTALDPYSADFHAGLGSIYQKRGDLEAARREYDRAVALNEQHVAARSNRAEVLLQVGEVDAAVEDLARAVALDPEGQHGHGQRARAMLLALGAMVQQAMAPRR